MTWIKITIFAIFISAGVIKWIYARLQEQAARKRAEEALARRMTEELRTGRSSENRGQPMAVATAPPMGQDPQERLRELARARQEQLRQMRESTTARSPVPSSAPATPVAAPVPMSGDSARRRQQEAQKRKAAAKQRQREVAEQQARQSRQREALEEAEEARSNQRRRQRANVAEADVYAVADPFTTRPAAPQAGGWTAQRVRDAWVVSEILSPPLALRAEASGGAGPGSSNSIIGAVLQQPPLGL
ncbi:MAG: hypothetical protein ACT4PL_06750 [Phycisphaerales bacterium]